VAKTLSQVCQAFVEAIEAITTDKRGGETDVFRGRVGYPDTTGGDRAFGVTATFGGVRALAAPGGTVVCPDVHEVEVFITVHYTWTDSMMVRVLDDGEAMTEALEGLRASDADIIEMLLDVPDLVVEGDGGLVVVTRSCVVQYQRA